MNAPVVIAPDPAAGKTGGQLDSLRQLTLIVYIFYALVWLTGITGIAGIVIDYVKREDAAGTLYESHFAWQIRTFWWGLAGGVLGLLTLPLFGLGLVIWNVTCIWYIYRLVKGILNWTDRKPLPN